MAVNCRNSNKYPGCPPKRYQPMRDFVLLLSSHPSYS